MGPFKYICRDCKFEFWKQPKAGSTCPMCKGYLLDVQNFEAWSNNPKKL